jgi:antirestriction protein ArdC
MTTEQAKSLSETAIAKLMDALERGQSDALKNYLSVMSRFHRYSWGNILLIYSQRPDATRVAGFHSWLKMRRSVRKGEKGIAILAPMVGRKKSDDQLTEDEQTRLFGFRAAHVFDVSQTDGEPLPEFATVSGDPRDHVERVTQFVARQDIVLEYDGRIAPARGLSHGGKITLVPDNGAGRAFRGSGARSRSRGDESGDRRKDTTHTVRETEAEAVAFVVCSAIGLDTNTSSSDYIRLHNGDAEILGQSLTLVQQTASMILKAIEPEDNVAQSRENLIASRSAT